MQPLREDTFTAIAWGLYYDGSGGLKEEVHRRLILIDRFVCFGYTELSTHTFEWAVSECPDPDAAKEYALSLTELSETWGCTLVDQPRIRVIEQPFNQTERWLKTLIGDTTKRHIGLSAAYTQTINEGMPL